VGIGDRSTDEQIISLVRQGRNIMPAFSEGKLSDGQLRDILAFLKALK
jgi:mono/diheme cytochrome c family protein